MRGGLLIGLGLGLLLAACSGGAAAQRSDRDPGRATEVPYEIETILPKDAIPSIDDPAFYSVEEANEEYEESEQVIGLELDGEARAYSVPLLSSHEIVNDNVKGRPIAVTW